MLWRGSCQPVMSNVPVGDSGLRKTPWAHQLGLCVAAGKPFGHAVKQGRVLYFDLENGREEILGVGRSICGYLGVEGFFPAEFLVLSADGNTPSIALGWPSPDRSLI